MPDTFHYTVIGSGMQGTAEGYDLARFGDAERIIMADIREDVARDAAQRINRLIGGEIAEARGLDATDYPSLVRLLREVDTCCAAAHYALNVDLTRAAVEAGCHFCDLGGNTEVVRKQHTFSADAAARGVSVVPDCGLAPGLGNILAARALNRMPCDSIQIRCGGLPRIPRPPLGYRIVFSVAGLTNEYTGNAVEIRNGSIVEIPAFTECETIRFPEPVGECEAFITSGGTSTGPWSFLGKVREYGYKTVRYPGHYLRVRSFIDLGFLDTRPVQVGTVRVAPRDLFHVLARKALSFPEDTDLVVLRVTATGAGDPSQRSCMIQEMIDLHDPATGFSAIERTTAFPAAIVAIMMTRGEIPPGVHALELAVNGDRMVKELARRDIIIQTTEQPPG